MAFSYDIAEYSLTNLLSNPTKKPVQVLLESGESLAEVVIETSMKTTLITSDLVKRT